MPDKVERFSVRLTEAHSGARVVLKQAPDGSMVRYSDYERLEAQLAEVKEAWCRSDEEKNAAHVKVMAAATEKRQELESAVAGWKERAIAAEEALKAMAEVAKR